MQKTNKKIPKIFYYQQFLRSFSYHYGLTKVLTYPYQVDIELTNFCNLKCIMCAQGEEVMTRKKQFMPFSLVKKIINELRGHCVKIWLSNIGESFLHKQVLDIINFVSANVYKCGIVTNGTLLDKDKIKKIVFSNLYQIKFSIDAFNEEEYKKIRIGGDFDKVRENIHYFISLKQKKYPTLKEEKLKYSWPQIVVSSLANMKFKNIRLFNDYWSKYPVFIDNQQLIDYMGVLKEVKNLMVKKSKSIPVNKTRLPCLRLWSRVTIQVNGDTVICCADINSKTVIGNIQSSTLKTIWNSTKMQKHRRQHLEGNFKSICSNCNEYEMTPQNKLFFIKWIGKILNANNKMS